MTSATSTAAATTGARQNKHQRATSRGVSALMYASQQGGVSKVRKIIREQSASLFARDRTGKSALHYTCTSDRTTSAQAADLLVMAAPDLVESHDEDGFTPLHLAVIAGNISLVTFLLANKADVNAVDNEKHTVVHWATVCGETVALRSVLAAGAPVSTPDVHGGFPLHYAAQMCGGDKDPTLGLQVLQSLLTHSDIQVSVADGDGRQPLLWAASAGSAKAVLALIRAGASVESPDKDGLTALHCAASRGHTDCIDTLLTLCGASPDVIDSNGCTALHYAVTLGHADATALLLVHGADPNRQDRKGRSPAHCGCAKGQFETVKMIGAHGGNLWLRNARGDLPLHEAAGSGRRDLVRWLLDMRPSQVNARNNDGRCPLHLAALNDNADMCKILLDAGAAVNPILRTSKNTFMTPLDCALQRGFRSTAKYLQLHGGVPASRLGDLKNRPMYSTVSSGVNLQIRDDVTFWGDTSSDSERENGGDTNRADKKVQRKKLSTKYEKKRASLSGSDLENNKILIGKTESSRPKRKLNEKNRRVKTGGGNDSAVSIDYSKRGSSRKAPSGRLDYTNEIVINGKTEVNIHHSKQITLGKDVQDILADNLITTDGNKLPETISEKEKRPKSAKISKVRDKSSASSVKDESAESNQKIDKSEKAEKKSKQKSGKKINGGTVKTTEQVIKEKVDEDQRSKVNTTLPDQQSIVSNTSEDTPESKSMVVEADLHEPPKNVKQEVEEDVLVKSHEQGNEEISPIHDTEHTPVEEESAVDKENKAALTAESDRNENAVEVVDQTGKSDADKELDLNVENKDSKFVHETIKAENKDDKASNESDILSAKEQEGNESIVADKSETVTAESISKTVKDEIVGGVETIADKLEESVEEGKNLLVHNTEGENIANEEIDKLEISQIQEDSEKAKTAEGEEARIDLETEFVDVIGEAKIKTSEKSEKTTEESEERSTKENEKSDENLQLELEKVKSSGKKSKRKKRSLKPEEIQKNAEIDSSGEQIKHTEASLTQGDKKSLEDSSSIIVKDENGKSQVKKERRRERGDKIKKESKVAAKEPKKSGRKRKDSGKVRKDAKVEDEIIDENGGNKQIDIDNQVDEGEGEVDKGKHQKRGQRKNKKNGKDQAYEIIYKTLAKDEQSDNYETKPEHESSSSDLESDTSSCSSTSSVTVQEHKSFRVLDEKEAKEIDNLKKKREPKMSRGKSTIKKQRSRSEENRKGSRHNETEKGHKSKIPTLLGRKHLSKSDKYLHIPDRKIKSNLESRIPSLPNINEPNKEPPRSDSNMSAPLLASIYSDNERGSASDLEDQRTSAVRKKKLKRRPKTKERDARSAGSDYESSNVIDSGFEPSPRSSRIPKWKHMTERGVNMTSVTQSIQTNIRRYHLERKIFQQLLELKRMQIRAGQHNEAILVKRAIDGYHQSCASTVGAGRYVPEDFTFKSFERFLYLALRKLQRNGADHLKGLPETDTNPLLCTQSTHRCMHATHAYTGIPCAAYLPKMDHHSIPKIGFTSTECKPGTGFLPTINASKKAVTLELCHGNDKQIISLPADRLDHNKRYYVTFTVKGSEPSALDLEEEAAGQKKEDIGSNGEA